MENRYCEDVAKKMAVNAQLLINAHIEFIKHTLSKEESKELKSTAIKIFKKYGIPTTVIENEEDK